MTNTTRPQRTRFPQQRVKPLAWILFAVVTGLLHLAYTPTPVYAADEICNLAPDGTLTCPSDPSNEPQPAFPPPDLLSPRVVAEASPAQADALRRLQEKAVEVVMTRHDLPASDRDAVQSWGRTEAQAALWGVVYEAIDTRAQNRTPDQQQAVDWMASLVRAQAVNTAKAAAGEYASWVGLDVDEYWSKVNSGISQDQLTNFLSIDARPYDTADTSRATSGYCKYRAPAPYESEYTGYLFQTCYTPCTAFDCDAPRPSYEQFVRWGDAVANRSLTSTSHLANAAAIAQAVTITNTLAGVAGLGTLTLPVGAAIFSLAVATVVTITPGAFVATGALGAVFASTAVIAVLAVLAAIAGTVFLSIRLNDELALPGKMAALVVGARDAAYDPATLIETDEGVSTLFGLFADAALPIPDAVRRCDNSLIPVAYYGLPGTTVTVYDPETGQPKLVNANPCLNPPAVPPASETDPRFVIRTTDSVRVNESPSITVAVPDGDDATTDSAAVVRMSGHWFVQRPQAGGEESAVQTLGVSFTDWDGEASYAKLVEHEGSYLFVGVSGQGGAYALEGCGSDGSCWRTLTLRYLGPDGQRYQAYVKPPSTQAQVIELADIADKKYGGQVTLAATGGLSSQPVTFTAGPQAVCTSSGLNGSKVALVGVGECTVTANQAGDGSGFLAASPVTRSFQVTPAPLDIRAEPKTKTYGAPNPEFTAQVGPLVNGDTRDDITGLVLTGPPADSGVGQYDIVPSGASNPNYEIHYGNGPLDVQPAEATVTADDKTRVYGAPVPAYTAHIDGLVNGDTRADITGLELAGPPTSAHVGLYPIHVRVAANHNYRFTYRDGAETITPASLTIKAEDKTVKYGTVPAYTWTAVGWVNGDRTSALDTAPTCKATIQGAAASLTSAPGAYLGAITCAGGADRDYAISYASAKLTVNPVIRLSQTGLPTTVPPRATIDGQSIALPTGELEVGLGTTHSYAFPAVVTDPNGVPYMTTTPGFSGPVASNLNVTAAYATMTSVVDAAMTSGGVDRNQATPLKSKWTTVQGYLRTGNLAAARTALHEFATQVRSQSGKKIKKPTADALLAYAQSVYTSIGGTGTV